MTFFSWILLWAQIIGKACTCMATHWQIADLPCSHTTHASTQPAEQALCAISRRSVVCQFMHYYWAIVDQHCGCVTCSHEPQNAQWLTPVSQSFIFASQLGDKFVAPFASLTVPAQHQHSSVDIRYTVTMHWQLHLQLHKSSITVLPTVFASSCCR